MGSPGEALAVVPEVFPELQPELFDGAWPMDAALEQQAKEYLHTGKIVCKDAERVERVCRAVLLRIPARKIAKREKIGRESIDAIVAHAHATGKLRPISEALLEEATEITMLAGHELKEALVNGRVQPQCLGMVWGTGVDKIRDLTHLMSGFEAPKEGVDQESLLRAAFIAAAAAKRLAQQASALPVDSGSQAVSAQVIAVQATDAPEADAATAPATGTALQTPPTTPATLALDAATMATTTPAPEGGRGVTPMPPPPDAQGATPENFDP